MPETIWKPKTDDKLVHAVRLFSIFAGIYLSGVPVYGCSQGEIKKWIKDLDKP